MEIHFTLLTDTGILPTPLKVFLAGCPLTPVPRIAGAIIYAASHPDPATSGCAYVLPDDGPVFKVPREEFKAGVYQLLEGKLQYVLPCTDTLFTDCFF